MRTIIAVATLAVFSAISLAQAEGGYYYQGPGVYCPPGFQIVDERRYVPMNRHGQRYFGDDGGRHDPRRNPRMRHHGGQGRYAHPTGEPYRRPPTFTENGIRYTGNSCIRRNGDTGREGYRGQQLGCWKF